MKKQLLILIIGLLTLSSCTQNERARNYGGTETIQLKQNEILLNVTWKQDDLWILTEDTTTHNQYFRESSSWGVFEGEINFK